MADCNFDQQVISSLKWHIAGWMAWAVLLQGCRPAPDASAEKNHSAATAPFRPTKKAPATQIKQSDRPQPSPVHFQLLAPSEAGIDFTYYGNPSPEHYMTEQNGGGVALLDFDSDGVPDVFLTNGSHFERPADPVIDTHRLYRNRFTAERILTFRDVSQESRLNVTGFGMGVATGDYDNDGFFDLFICYFGADQLWRNNGDGTFTDLTTEARVTDDAWSASAAFADLDGDGDLDLYVANYVVYDPSDPPCFTQHQTPIKISCGPIGRKGEPDRLWENLGDGHFQDASSKSGIHKVQAAQGLAVEIVDLDGDDLLDIFVANDTSVNFLFHNQGGLSFTETAIESGVAFSADGAAGSSMGIACADFDRNGRLDLFVTNFENATNDYYDNLFDSTFLHRSGAMGLDTPSRPMLAFGTVAADFDLDGWADLFVANGHIWDLTSLNFGHLYEMPPQLFHNLQGKRFNDDSQGAGDYFSNQWLGRAVAIGDLDLDGDSDLIVTHELKPAAVLKNDSQRSGRSAILKLTGRNATRSPLGTRISYRCDSVNYLHHIPAGGSFQASHDPKIILSCGGAENIESLTVHWSPGHSESWLNLPVGTEIELTEGAPGFRSKTIPSN